MKPYFENRTYSQSNPIDAFILNDFTFLAHWHMDIELVYVLEGSIVMGINKEFRILRQGEAAICNSKDIHYYDSKGMHSVIIIVIFKSDYIKALGGWPENSRFSISFIDSRLFAESGDSLQENIKDLFCCLVEESHNKKKFHDLYIKGKILELMALAFRYFPFHTISSNKESSGLPYIKPMQEALQYLEDNYMNDITLEDLSRRVNFSPFYMSRLFKQITNINFKAFLNRIRIEKAENMIRDSVKSIAEISFECGFNSIRAFNRSFKSIKGYTPTSVRKPS